MLLPSKVDPVRDTALVQEVGRPFRSVRQLTFSRNDDWVHHPLADVYLELCDGMFDRSPLDVLLIIRLLLSVQASLEMYEDLLDDFGATDK